MKILVGEFVSETNENIPKQARINNYVIAFDEDCINHLDIKDVYDDEGVEMIPSIYANGSSGGLITRETFDYIETSLLRKVKEVAQEIDGIFLMLHGASKVEGLGSGDHHIIKEVRKIVGDYIPVCVSCDPHGNLTKEYVESLQIIRSYRESPHVDANPTKEKVYKMTCELVANRQNIHSVYRKLPLILGGEQSVSTDEPVLSINKYMDELEKDPRIKSASWHVGYLRHDCPEAGCGIVVVPETEADQTYAEEMADKLAKYVWDKRHEFHYTGTTASLEDSIKMAMACDGKPFTITDSGDNTTSGATGWNTTILRKALALNSEKSWLFASIKDEKRYLELSRLADGTKTKITLGEGYNKNSEQVDLEVEVLKKAPVYISHGEVNVGTKGNAVLVHVLNTNIDIIIAEKTARMTNASQIAYFGIEWSDYDIVVLKQGYIFPDFKMGSKDYVMALTDGATPQDTKNIPFKLVMRPMYPLDEI